MEVLTTLARHHVQRHRARPASPLASRAGIAADYHDIAGTLHVTSDDTRRAILSSMGFDVASRESLLQALIDLDDAPGDRRAIRILILQQGYAPRRGVADLQSSRTKSRN